MSPGTIILRFCHSFAIPAVNSYDKAYKSLSSNETELVWNIVCKQNNLWQHTYFSYINLRYTETAGKCTQVFPNSINHTHVGNVYNDPVWTQEWALMKKYSRSIQIWLSTQYFENVWPPQIQKANNIEPCAFRKCLQSDVWDLNWWTDPD